MGQRFATLSLKTFAKVNELHTPHQKRNIFATVQKQNEPMIARPLDGRLHATRIRAELEARIRTLNDRGVIPTLGIVIVGSEPASTAYVKTIERTALRLGLAIRLVELAETSTVFEVTKALATLSHDPSIHGIVLQQPLPPHLAIDSLSAHIAPEKDVDGTNPTTQGHLTVGSKALFCPATPQAVLELLKISAAWPVLGRHAVIVGKSNVVGLPVALLLLHEGATVSVTHIDTPDLTHFTLQADIIVTATGVPNLIRGSMLKPGAVVIDVGTCLVGETIVGDVEWATCALIAHQITPVPGGVGPVTTATLLANVVASAQRSALLI